MNSGPGRKISLDDHVPNPGDDRLMKARAGDGSAILKIDRHPSACVRIVLVIHSSVLPPSV